MSNPEAEVNKLESGKTTLDTLRNLAKQPEQYNTPEAAETAFDAVRTLTSEIALDKGQAKELAEALAHEEMLLNRKSQLNAYAEGGDAIESFQRSQQENLLLASKLFEYSEGKTEMTDEIKGVLQARIDEINSELDQLGNEFAHDKIAEIKGTNDPLSLHRFEQEYRHLAEVRSGGLTRELQSQAPTQPEFVQTVQQAAAEKEQAVQKARQAVEKATGNEAETGLDKDQVPTDRRGLIGYEREHFKEYDAGKIDQLKAYVDATLTMLESNHATLADPENTRYPDTVAGVMGNGGEAVMFLGRTINEARPPGEKYDDVSEILRLPFSEVAKQYLGMDVETSHPEYFQIFSRR
jgi:hypothetical protein